MIHCWRYPSPVRVLGFAPPFFIRFWEIVSDGTPLYARYFDRKVDSGKLTKVFRQCEWSVWVVSVSVDIFYPVLRRFKERLLREVLDVTVDGRLGQSDFRGDFSDRFPLLV